MNPESVSNFRNAYSNGKSNGIECLLSDQLQDGIIRCFCSILAFDDGAVKPQMCYQLLDGFPMPDIDIGDINGRSIFELNTLLRKPPYTIALDDVPASIKTLFPRSVCVGGSDFDDSVKNVLFSEQRFENYTAELRRLDKLLFSPHSDHYNLVVPVYSAGTWYSFLYLVVKNRDKWTDFLRQETAFPLLIGESFYQLGIYNPIINKSVAIRYKTELFQVVFAIAPVSLDLDQNKWRINVEGATTEPKTMVLDGTEIELVGFSENALLRLSNIEKRYSVYTKLDYARRAAARAAVFARNFSHIIGSHVISSPHFRDALAGNDLRRRYHDSLRRSHQSFTKARYDLFSAGDDVNTDRLWRIATKILDQAVTDLGSAGVLLENTRLFHEFLQGRFDFIARAIDEIHDQPEPILFVKDLLEGFLRQTAFLDTLVSDVGLKLDNMTFRIHLPECEPNQPFEVMWKPSRNSCKIESKEIPPNELRWVEPADKPIAQHDVLIGVPGGMISAHAFYSLLENIIRNSAKYSKPSHEAHGKSYLIDLQLLKVEGHYELRIWDNYSKSKDLAAKLGKALGEDFVNVKGEQQTTGLGLLEMQACAGMLCNADSDKNYPDKRTGLPEEKTKNLWCEGHGDDADDNMPLVYHLSLNAPLLLGVVSSTWKDPKRPICCSIKSPDALRQQLPYLLVIDGAFDNRKDWLEKIEANPQAFPYRMLVLCENEADEKTWNHAIKKHPKIPLRRIGLTTCPTLYGSVFTNESNAQSAEQAILASYDAWLRSWKGRPGGQTDGKWHLWIGMERGAEQVEAAWKRALEKFSSPLIQVGVFSKEQGGSDLPQSWPSSVQQPDKSYWNAELAAKTTDKRALVFDNHGTCFEDAFDAENEPDFRKSTRFYQKLSGDGTPDLFLTLSRPPTDSFLFSFFVHALVESCLTHVMVIDERVAWDLVNSGGAGTEPNNSFAIDLASHQKAGVFPIFRFRPAGSEDTEGYYNEAHRVLMLRSARDHGTALSHEGVTYNRDNPASLLHLLVPTSLDAFEAIPAGGINPNCDVLLIHEGALDILFAHQPESWAREYIDLLKSITPAVVRTSGRGRSSPKMGGHLPFIEFGEVSSALLTARNKYSLVRGLLGTAGSPETS